MIDLHVHTYCSDGEHSPEKTVEIAKLSGITDVAITDHDTCTGVERAMIKGREIGIEVIPGIEVTAYESEEIHVLGYYVNYKSSKLDDYAELLKKDLKNEENIIFDTFHELGFEVTRDEIIEKYAMGTPIAPGHFVDWLIDNGFESNKKSTYTKYFRNGKLAHRKADRMKVSEAVKFIKSIGGVPVLAHPIRISWNLKQLVSNIIELKEYGLMGLEAIYSMSDEDSIREHMKIARNTGLLITLGSDYHGHKVKDYIDIGYGERNSLVKYQDVKLTNRILHELRQNELSMII